MTVSDIRSPQEVDHSSFDALSNGRLTGVLNWQRMDDFWALLRKNPSGWFVYECENNAPTTPLSNTEFQSFLDSAMAFLRERDTMSNCGAVYTDDQNAPEFTKIFDPKNMGSACGSSKTPVLPKWIISRVAPRAFTPIAEEASKGSKSMLQRLFPN